MIIILEVVEGPETGRSITVNDGQTCLIGRVSGDLVLEKDPLVSGQHFSITNDGQNCIVTDLESRNHVFVDGEQIPPLTKLHVGNQSRITAGTTTVFLVNLSRDPTPKKVDQSTPESNKNFGYETINELPAEKEKASNFGFDLDQFEDAEEKSTKGNTKLPPEDLPKKEMKGSVPESNRAAKPPAKRKGTEKTSPFDFSDVERPVISSSRSGSDPELSEDDSESIFLDETTAPSQKTSFIKTPEKHSSNFSESIYIPGQKTTKPVSNIPAPPSLSPAIKQKQIEFERIVSEEGVYVFGGIGDAEDAPMAANEMLIRLKDLGCVVCLTHSFESKSEKSIGETSEQNDEVDFPKEKGGGENDADPIGKSAKSPILTVPLFHWLPEEVSRSAGPVMIDLNDLPDFAGINTKQWGANSVMWLIGEDVKKLIDHMSLIIRMDLKTGKQADGVLGICWPIILSSILDGKEKSAVSRIFGENLKAILFEDPDSKYLWRFASTVDWSEKLQTASIGEKK